MSKWPAACATVTPWVWPFAHMMMLMLMMQSTSCACNNGSGQAAAETGWSTTPDRHWDTVVTRHHCMITHYVEVPVSADISYDFRLLFVRLLIRVVPRLLFLFCYWSLSIVPTRISFVYELPVHTGSSLTSSSLSYGAYGDDWALSFAAAHASRSNSHDSVSGFQQLPRGFD